MAVMNKPSDPLSSAPPSIRILLAGVTVAGAEQRQEFDQLVADLIEAFHPESYLQWHWVGQLAECLWERRRLIILKTGMLASSVTEFHGTAVKRKRSKTASPEQFASAYEAYSDQYLAIENLLSRNDPRVRTLMREKEIYWTIPQLTRQAPKLLPDDSGSSAEREGGRRESQLAQERD
jgi:hypothetical protein